MKCKNYFFSLFVALLGVFFGSCIINQNNTYALSDITYTFDSSNYSSYQSGNPFYICRDSTTPCSGYRYLTISFNNLDVDYTDSNMSNIRAYRLYIGVGGTTSVNNNLFFYNGSSVYYFDLPRLTYYNYLRVYFDNVVNLATYFPNWSVIVTLSENNPFSGSQPSGSISITENGTYDVSQYAEAVVNVPETDCPPTSGGGDYHEDLVAINNSILICAAVCLVIYFFYCIYRMIIKNSGVK